MRPWSLVALFVLLCGCYHAQYAVSGTTPEPEPRSSEWRHHLFSGLVAFDSDIDVRAICPHGVSRIVHEMAPLNVVVTVLTGTIYSPMTSRVYCQTEEPAPAPDAAPTRADSPASMDAGHDAPAVDAGVADAALGTGQLLESEPSLVDR